MARCVTIALFLLASVAVGRSQFFADLFQSFQPYVTTRPTLRQYEQSTKRTTEHTRNNHKTTKNEQTTKSYGSNRSNAFSSQYSSTERDENRRRQSTNNYYTTTVKPKKINSSRRIIKNEKKDQNIQVENNNKEYDGKINSISDYYTQKPNYDPGNYRRNNYYTTNNPLYNRPGVRPAFVDDRPPITNRPVTRRPNFGVNPRPKDEDAIAFPDDGDASPEVIIGPDEDYMSAVEKKRYIELSERMCDKYKSIGTKAVQAIPLLPSPVPVRVNVSGCAPTNVPLVVGGKVVGIKEFPHMALLGWRKLQDPGYSWKCGGSLVSEQFVLTAGHCSLQDRDNTVVNGPPGAVQLGSSYLDDPGALVVRAASVIRHPKYKPPRSYYDLALVKLVNAVKFSEVIKPACLGVPPAVGESIIATGWGRTEYGGDQSHELRSVSLPVWDMSRCQDVLGTSRKLPEGPSAASQLCAGEERGGKDTCQGDSGGPAQLQEGCAWRVVAVTSLGRSCGAAETPGLYAIVHRAFVASQIFGAQNKHNNANSGSNNHNSDSNNQDYGNNNGQNYNNGPRPSNNGNYNGQNNYDGQNGYERPQDNVNIRPGNNNYYNNGQYDRDRPNGNVNYNYPQVNDNYNNNGPKYATESSNGNSGSNNRHQNDYNSNNNQYNQQGTRYTTQKPNYRTERPDRNDYSGIFNNDYNREDSQTEYTTKSPIRNNNGYRSESNSDYANNNEGDYINQSNQRTQNNYENNRRTSNQNYTVNRPWWLTY